uniref:A.thaliana homeobox gene Athb-1 mRNA n=1 Tax=Arabidopsis thaliana TaxID=3702 RepID=A2NW03_ARATH|nr:hypothetical protein 2 - Arabidopsis thaliana [Arabidopsis thaliana]CAA41624.1 unnamed protein product [Arabidopsis thaliana]
MEYKLLPP